MAEGQADRQAAPLNIPPDRYETLNRIATAFLTASDLEVYAEVLDVVLDAMESEYGVFGYLDDEMTLVIPSFTRRVWGACRIPNKTFSFPRETWGEALWGKALRGRMPALSNEPSTRTPLGHLPIHRSLAVPILFRSAPIGLLLVANRATDYDDAVAAELVAIADHIAPILAARLERDREERRRMEAEESLKLLQCAMDNAIELILLVDSRGRLTYANDSARRSLGLSGEELRCVNLQDVAPELSPKRLALSHREAAKSRPAPFETIYRNVGGETFPVEVTVSHLDFRDSVFHQVSARDIAERELLQAQLAQYHKQEAVGRLAAGLAHEFNNMMMVIQGHCSLALATAPNDPRVHRHLEEIRTAIGQAAALPRQVLSFGRHTSRHVQVFELTDQVTETVDMLRRLIGENIELVEIGGSSPLFVRADPSQITQVILNLVVNGKDALPTGGAIIVRTERTELEAAREGPWGSAPPGRYALIEVSDTGQGMDEGTLEHIFEPFYTTKKEGTGLGLSIVKQIVDEMGGRVFVQSSPGQGTTFEVLVPSVEPTIEIQESPLSFEIQAGHGETILIAEDDERVRLLVRDILEQEKYAVLEASDGREALKIVEQHHGPIDLLVTDILMPNMSGCELAERVRALRPRLPIIFLSGYAENTAIRAAVQGEGKVFVPKPCTPSVLLNTIHELLVSSS